MWIIKSPYLISSQYSFWPWPETGTQSSCWPPSSQHTWHVLMLISDALCADMGSCPAASCLTVRLLRIQEGKTKITKLLGKINDGLRVWGANPHAQAPNREKTRKIRVGRFTLKIYCGTITYYLLKNRTSLLLVTFGLLQYQMWWKFFSLIKCFMFIIWFINSLSSCSLLC